MEIGKKSLFYRMNEITQTVSVKDTGLLTGSKFLGMYSNNMAKTCPLQKLAHAIYRDFFSVVKLENFVGKILIFFLFLLKT